MLPGIAAYDIRDGRAGYSIGSCYASMDFTRSCSLAYISDILFRKTGEVVARTLHRVPVIFPINEIVNPCIPAEIFNAVVCPNAVVVACFHAWGTRSNEGHQDKTVNRKNEAAFIIAQEDSKISTTFVKSWFLRYRDLTFRETFRFANVQCPNVTFVADFVKWIIGYSAPFFAHSSLQTKRLWQVPGCVTNRVAKGVKHIISGFAQLVTGSFYHEFARI